MKVKYIALVGVLVASGACSDSDRPATVPISVDNTVPPQSPPPPPPPPPPSSTTIDDTTVSGVDADGDGIRDDIEEYLEERFPDAEAQFAVREYARGLQEFVTFDPADSDTSLIIDAAERSGLAAICGTSLIENSSQEELLIKARTLNTELRQEAYTTIELRLAGALITLPTPEEMNAYCAELRAGEMEN